MTNLNSYNIMCVLPEGQSYTL